MAGWTDYCPDWSSKDKLRLCSVYDALSALTTAVNERGSVLSDYIPLPEVKRLYPLKYYVDLIDAKVKEIVPLFVNHTVNGGDFTGLEAIPMWTWNTILNGEAEASIDRLYPVLDWVYQRYEIINKLRWIKRAIVGAYLSHLRYDGYGNGATIEAAILDAYANLTQNTSTSSETGHSHITSQDYGGILGDVSLREAYYRFNITSYSDFSFNASIWALVIGPALGGLDGGYFDGFGIYEQGVNKIYSTNTTGTYDIKVGDITARQEQYPSEVDYIKGRGFTVTNDFSIVYKFDSTNGFQFKDW